MVQKTKEQSIGLLWGSVSGNFFPTSVQRVCRDVLYESSTLEVYHIKVFIKAIGIWQIGAGPEETFKQIKYIGHKNVLKIPPWRRNMMMNFD